MAENRLFFLLNLAQHRVFRYVEQEASEQLGISVTHVGVLMFLNKHPGSLQVEVAEEMGLNKPAVTGLANRMEKLDLIIRKPCEMDGRATRLYLTKKSQDILPKINPLIIQLNSKMFGDFKEAELKIIGKFLNHLLEEF